MRRERKSTNRKKKIEVILTAGDKQKEAVLFFFFLSSLYSALTVGREKWWMEQVGVSEGPSVLCARVHGESGGL